MFSRIVLILFIFFGYARSMHDPNFNTIFVDKLKATASGRYGKATMLSPDRLRQLHDKGQELGFTVPENHTNITIDNTNTLFYMVEVPEGSDAGLAYASFGINPLKNNFSSANNLKALGIGVQLPEERAGRMISANAILYLDGVLQLAQKIEVNVPNNYNVIEAGLLCDTFVSDSPPSDSELLKTYKILVALQLEETESFKRTLIQRRLRRAALAMPLKPAEPI